VAAACWLPPSRLALYHISTALPWSSSPSFPTPLLSSVSIHSHCSSVYIVCERIQRRLAASNPLPSVFPHCGICSHPFEKTALRHCPLLRATSTRTRRRTADSDFDCVDGIDTILSTTTGPCLRWLYNLRSLAGTAVQASTDRSL
jgi:hypothetical protein